MPWRLAGITAVLDSVGSRVVELALARGVPASRINSVAVDDGAATYGISTVGGGGKTAAELAELARLAGSGELRAADPRGVPTGQGARGLRGTRSWPRPGQDRARAMTRGRQSRAVDAPFLEHATAAPSSVWAVFDGPEWCTGDRPVPWTMARPRRTRRRTASHPARRASRRPRCCRCGTTERLRLGDPITRLVPEFAAVTLPTADSPVPPSECC